MWGHQTAPRRRRGAYETLPTTHDNRPRQEQRRRVKKNRPRAIHFIMESKYKFLGVVDRRYLKSYTGLVHSISSLTALIIGNHLFIRCIILGHNSVFFGSLPTIFHAATLTSGLTLIPFWNEVQSWQHSTTTMKEKGLSPAQMKDFNRGRGVLAPILCAVYPLAARHLSEDWLQSAAFCRAVGAVVLALSMFQYRLIRDYGRALFVIYGGSKLGYSLNALLTGSLSDETAIAFLEKEALLVVCCVEFGFLWYYCESRKLVTKEFVREACKRYHPILMYTFVIRLTAERWWRSLPLSLAWVMALNTMLASLFFFKMIKSVVSNLRGNMEIADRREVFARKGRTSSVFDVASSSGRRSSIFESFKEM